MTGRPTTCQEAGRMGGLETARRHSREERAAWGRKGGQTTKTRYGPEHYRALGRKSAEVIRAKIASGELNAEEISRKKELGWQRRKETCGHDQDKLV